MSVRLCLTSFNFPRLDGNSSFEPVWLGLLPYEYSCITKMFSLPGVAIEK